MTNWNLDFLAEITKDEKIIGNRCNRRYFEMRNKVKIYDDYISNTNHLEYLITNRAKVSFLKAGHLTDKDIPKCYCGSKISFLNGKISKYCSKKCALSSSERRLKIIESKSKENKEVSNFKRKHTMKQKYGVEYNSQRQDIKSILSNTKLPDEIFLKLSDKTWLDNEYNVKKRSSVDIAKELNCYYSTVLYYCNLHEFKIRRTSNYSLVEVEIKQFIESLGFVVEHSNWELLDNLEVDLYIPSKKIAIEIDGLYWHSLGKGEETKENKNKHLSKTNLLLDKGINLIHITDFEWNNKQNIVKNIIKNKLGLSTKIYARLCKVLEVDSKDTKEFLENNHIQGYCSSKVNYGIYHENELVMLCTFSSPRFNKKYDWELIRMATKSGLSIIGGASKLIYNFRKKHIGSIITYSDNRFGTGNVYSKCGFEFLSISSPGYFWTDGTNVISRFKTQKQNLKKWLVSFNEELSESDNMFNAKYKRFWDCGNRLFLLNK